MGKKFYYDMLERVIWTFVQAFAGAFLALLTVTDTPGWEALAGSVLSALIAGIIAVCKAFIAGQYGVKGTAALPDPVNAVKTFGARK